MSEDALIDFYRMVREDEALMQRLSSCRDLGTLITALRTEAASRGFEISADTVGEALSDIKSFIDIANDDELTDLELELVSAGAAITDQGGPKGGWGP